LPSRRVATTLVRSYRTFSPLQPTPYGVACRVFLWHFPAGFPGWTLSSTLLCGVRTFLDGLRPRTGDRRDYPGCKADYTANR